MKNNFYLLLALVMLAQLSWAATVTPPEDMSDYYSNANGKSGKSLYEALNTIANVGFKSLGYDGALNAYQKSDVYPTDPSNPNYDAGKAGKLWDMYGGCSFVAGDECGSYKEECDCYNREHSIPKSWWGGGKNDMYSDIFHLVPTDGYVNNRRSNYAFGEVSGSPTYQYNGCKLGSPASVSTDKETLLGTSATTSASPVFEPRDDYKGDFARGYLGMIAKYSNSSYSITSGAGGEIFEAFKSTSHFGLTKYGIVLLMKWHRQDPVSQKEIDRNNGIQATQGNRNPFIDYPYLAEYIWGDHAGESVDLANLIASCEEGFVPGQSDGWRSGTTPVQPTVKFGINWSVNGEILQTDSVKDGGQVKEMPAEPQSCSSESETFVGWTDKPIEFIADEAPAVLYKAANEIPSMKADLTLYAVFAHAESDGATEPAVFTFDENHQEGWNCTASNTGSYWLLDQGKVLTSPEVDLAGLSSIKVNMRTYGGSQYDELDVKAGETLIAQIQATGGNKLNDYEWKNTKSLSGIAQLTFSTNYGEKKGIGFTSVVINATGAGLTFSRYITTCQSHEEVTNIYVDAPARKVLIGTQIYILVGDELYTITGQKVHK